MGLLMSPARRSILRATGVLIAVLLAASGASAFAFAARPGPGRLVPAKAVPGRPLQSGWRPISWSATACPA